MRILINASNLKAGGGLQVADSVCRMLDRFPQHEFSVVLSSALSGTYAAIKDVPNITAYIYDVRRNALSLLLGRDLFLDNLVQEAGIESVLTIFGPSVWIPRAPHLCGFARAQMVIKESPFYTGMKTPARWKQRLRYCIRAKAFKRCSQSFYTENPYISERLGRMWGKKKIYTVSNYYNQVFDNEEQWREKALPSFEGVTLLTIAAPYAHKNLPIAAAVARILRQDRPECRFRFVMSIEPRELGADIGGIEDCFVFLGRVDIAECPSLYAQSDIVFLPTLLECFTAVYPEAMRMEKPIVTTDLEFARGLCGEAAEYYSAIDARSCAETIYRVATDAALRERLVEKGKAQLCRFDDYARRAEKLIALTERVALEKKS